MKEPDMEAINVDELMEKIKAEVRKRRGRDGKRDQISGSPSHVGDFTPDPARESAPMEYKEGGYHINDFLKYHNEDFVANAYQAVLSRSPDPSAFKYFLSNLRSGKMTKAEVLGRLRYPAEGRVRHVRIKGLFWNFLIQSSFGIPIFGYFIRLIIATLNLPKVVRNLQAMEASVSTQLKDQSNSLRGVSDTFQSRMDRFQSEMDTFQSRMDRFQSETDMFQPRMDTFQPRMDTFQSRMDTFQSRMDTFQSEMGDFQSKMDKAAAFHGESLTALEQKADKDEVSDLLRQKADTNELNERLKHKADLWVLEVLKERKADHEALEEVAAQKADREELAELNEKKVGREELVVVSEAKADVKDLIAMGEKADREELFELNEKKAGREELAELNEKKVGREELEEINESIQEQIRDMVRQIRDHKINLVDQERRLRLLLEEARKRLPETISTEQIEKMVEEEDHMLSAVYVGFEDKFRGTRKDIKGRQKVYLPLLRAAGAGTVGHPVLDVGCGRGEWLELLKENGLMAMGVDTNQVMQRACEDLGLQVEMGDAIEFLRKQKRDTLGAVTGFHIVEHLPTRKMIALFDEAMCVLKPGGIVIFETPNPENILVGSCTFYTDPTHRNPIPPHTLLYIIENRGFVGSEIVRSSPMDYASYKGKDALKHIFHRFNMEQDYAVIARKPS